MFYDSTIKNFVTQHKYQSLNIYRKGLAFLFEVKGVKIINNFDNVIIKS